MWPAVFSESNYLFCVMGFSLFPLSSSLCFYLFSYPFLSFCFSSYLFSISFLLASLPTGATDRLHLIYHRPCAVETQLEIVKTNDSPPSHSILTLRRLMSYIYIYIYIYMEHPFLMFLDHTQRRTTVGRTPLDE